MRTFFLSVITFLAVAASGSAQESTVYPFRVNGFFGTGGVISGGETNNIFHIGGGAEGQIYKGLGAGVEAGYLAPRQDWGAGIGTVSPNLNFHFVHSAEQKVVPFITGGYTLGFRGGSENLYNLGGGIDYWPKQHVGLRFDVRDHVLPSACCDATAHFLVFRVSLLGR
jgi:hypothetical protein